MANKRFDADMADITTEATKVLGIKPDGTVGTKLVGKFRKPISIETYTTGIQELLSITNYNANVGDEIGVKMLMGLFHLLQKSNYGTANNKFILGFNGTDLLSLEQSGNMLLTGNFSATGTITPGSDKRLKKSIKNLPTELDNILALRPVSYKLKVDDAPSLGFIADEVREVYPDLIIEGKGEDKMLAMNYMGLTAPIVKAMQEMNATIQSLTKRIEELEAK